MTIARTILDANLDDNIVIDENELMADAADACTSCQVWTDIDGFAHGIYYFADGSTLIVDPCEAVCR
jgi:hypothetical protein